MAAFSFARLGVRPGLSMLVASLVGILGGCAALDPSTHASELAATAGMHTQRLETQDFVLTAFVRVSDPARPVHVYIEGDGLAWLSPTQPSTDPTPHHAEGLALAAADHAANVVYVARPCQFTPMDLNTRCDDARWWTSDRYAPEVIDSMNAAVSQIAARAPGQKLDLVGYSGGGAVAVLVAARRRDVESIRTVAGNLDVEFVNDLHHVSRMPKSLSPIDSARTVSSIPQIHFSGGEDTVVPPAVATRFLTASGSRCARAVTVDGLTHDGDWAAQWGRLLGILPQCTGQAG
ncbi:alpha/beta hydrolase [Burkholderia gladioli]|uniref:alpha/beta hydrolase n=1 Tax=Burkholderia gladioli TaxID=28095 RepID=UPI001FC7F646|nr:alpha/beta hydrolase [Burkholderia gladioli]